MKIMSILRTKKPIPHRETTLEDVVKRLDAILNVLLRIQLADNKSFRVRDKVRILHNLGFRNREIAQTLGISQLHVGNVINELRKAES